MTSPTNRYREAFGDDDESLKLFIQHLKEFDDKFVKLMFKGGQFTLKLEMHGNNGQLEHCRVYTDEISRPNKENGKKGKKNQ